MKKRPSSYVDVLAKQLSEKTGSEFTVHRVSRAPYRSAFHQRIKGPEVPQQRYMLSAKRGNYTYIFQQSQPMKIDEMKRWLASLNDMLSMGFIRTPEYFPGVSYTRSQEDDK